MGGCEIQGVWPTLGIAVVDAKRSLRNSVGSLYPESGVLVARAVVMACAVKQLKARGILQYWLNSNKGTKCDIEVCELRALVGGFE